MIISGIPARLSLFFVVAFAFPSIQIPYWPIWLKDIGLSPSQIGFLLSCTYLVKTISNPTAGYIIDKYNNWRLLLFCLCFLGAITYSLYFTTENFWFLLAITLLNAALLSAVMSTSESLAVSMALAHRLNYGRIRLWGSISFVITTTITGRILGYHPSSIVLILGLSVLTATTICCFVLPPPAARPTETTKAETSKPPSLWSLLRHPLFLLFLVAISFIQVSHILYYGFSSLHWQKAGLSDLTIGFLWSEGVICEIMILAFSHRLLKILTPLQLIMIGAAAGIIRWGVLGSTDSALALFLVQWMHGLTFSVTHLGTLFFIARVVPPTIAARAQSLYFAIPLGLVQGSGMMIGGTLYEIWDGKAFFVMMALAACGGLTTLCLKYRWNGQQITL